MYLLIILNSLHVNIFFDFTSYLKSKGTEQKLTVHITPSQNGVVERHNHAIVEHICALLHASGLPRFLWEAA